MVKTSFFLCGIYEVIEKNIFFYTYTFYSRLIKIIIVHVHGIISHVSRFLKLVIKILFAKVKNWPKLPWIVIVYC